MCPKRNCAPEAGYKASPSSHGAHIYSGPIIQVSREGSEPRGFSKAWCGVERTRKLHEVTHHRPHGQSHVHILRQCGNHVPAALRHATGETNENGSLMSDKQGRGRAKMADFEQHSRERANVVDFGEHGRGKSEKWLISEDRAGEQYS